MVAQAQRRTFGGRITESNAKWWVLAVCCVTLFMAILDNLVVNVALPTISEDLGASPSQLQWVVNAYILVFASIQITAGSLGDMLGRKRFFIFGISLFTVTSAIAGLADSMDVLIAMRALQGLGAAFIMPLTLSLISEAFSPEERGRAIGLWSAISVSGLALGPIVGGYLVDYWSWHWIFMINVPIGIAALLLAFVVVHESRDATGRTRIDIPGTVLATSAIAALTWGLIRAGEESWTEPTVVAAFVAFAILLPLFVWVERRTEHPMVPMRFFRSTTFVGANIDSLAISFLIAGVSFSFTLYLQNVHDYSALRAGAAMLPMVAVMMVGAPLSGLVVNRVGARRMISIGMIITGIGMALFLRAGVDASYLDILPGYLVMGFGNSLIFAPMTTAVLNSVPSSESGTASAVNGAIREVGAAFGIALMGTIMNQTYRTTFEDQDTIHALRSDPNAAGLGGILDEVAEGINRAGAIVNFVFDQAAARVGQPVAPPELVSAIREASSRAFMAGMDQAIYISVAGILLASIVSYFLIRDDVFDKQPEATPEVVEGVRPESLVPSSAD